MNFTNHKNLLFIVIILFSLICCSEKVYEPYTFLVEDIENKNELISACLDSKTGDIYRSFQRRELDFRKVDIYRKFQLGGLLTDDNQEIPFDFKLPGGGIHEIRDSFAYIQISNKENEFIKTIKYRITKSGFIPIDSMLFYENDFKKGHFIWKKDQDVLFSELKGLDFKNGLKTEIQSIEASENKEEKLELLFNETGVFIVFQKNISNDSLIFSKKIDLSKIDKKSKHFWIYKLYVEENNAFIYFHKGHYQNDFHVAWIDLKTKNMKIIHLNNLYHSQRFSRGKYNGIRPVFFDNSKKVVLPTVGYLKPFVNYQYGRSMDYKVVCLNAKKGKIEWQIDFKAVLQDSVSFVRFYSKIIDVFKLNETEIGIIYKRSHTDPNLENTLPSLIIVDKKGNIKQKISPKRNSIGGIVTHQKDGAIRFATKNQNQYLVRGKIEEDSKYYWMNYFQNE